MTKEVREQIENDLMEEGIQAYLEENPNKKCYISAEKGDYIYVEAGCDVYENGNYVATEKSENEETYTALYDQKGNIVITWGQSFPYYHYYGNAKNVFLDDQNILLPSKVEEGQVQYFLEHFSLTGGKWSQVKVLDIGKGELPVQHFEDKKLVILKDKLYQYETKELVQPVVPYQQVIHPDDTAALAKMAFRWKIDSSLFNLFTSQFSVKLNQHHLLAAHIQVQEAEQDLHFTYDLLVLLNEQGKLATELDISNVYYADVFLPQVGLEESPSLGELKLKTEEELQEVVQVFHGKAQQRIESTLSVRSAKKERDRQMIKKWGN